MTSACPRCGAAATGKFCSECGASLAPLSCPSCGHAPPPGARFCNKCGGALASPGALAETSAPAGGDSQLAWWIAGSTLIVLIVLMAWPVIRPKPANQAPAAAAAPFAGGGGGAPGTGSPPDLSKMTPREAAERLFNRVMMAVENGDEATVQQFMPMALQAFDMAAPLDDLGLYELATLKRANGDFAGAIATAGSGLATKPDHLLLLAATAEAYGLLGDDANTEKFWQHFLDVFDVQHAMGLQEYRDYEQLLQETRKHALTVTGG